MLLVDGEDYNALTCPTHSRPVIYGRLRSPAQPRPELCSVAFFFGEPLLFWSLPVTTRSVWEFHYEN